jgi:hypothetical protein
MGMELDDSIVVAVLLNSLPEQFASMVLAWDQVRAALINAATGNSHSSNTAPALTAGIKCNYCKKTGYVKKDCHKRQRDRANRQSSSA